MTENMVLTMAVRDKMAHDRLMFAYRGLVTNDNSAFLLSLLDKEMELSGFSFIGRKRLFVFMLEDLQNITRHTLKTGHEVGSVVVYSKTNDGYTVSTGNAINRNEVPDLRKRLEDINRMDPEQIKEVYRTVLQVTDLTEKGGAGLGLLEMARKTGNRLDFNFSPLDKEHDYFILSKTVDSGGKGEHVAGKTPSYNPDLVIDLEKQMNDNGVYFIWTGHLSHDLGKEVLSFNETRLHEAEIENNLQKRVFTVLIELLQNMAEYSTGIKAEEKFGMPVAMIKNDGDFFIITSGNLIRKDDVEHLKEKLDLVNSEGVEGKKELLRKALENQDINVKSTGYLGLLEIARHSGEKLEYSFEDVNDEFSYYVVEARIRPKAKQVWI
ncbi:MAG TPA: SiaB family protein kinase [Bacteroidales bacterium]|nr:SiaB family protein kinase [Bacteroidales bacterium]HPT11164.1 SiaB family protein kinase [Bacteroidales bacterium]